MEFDQDFIERATLAAIEGAAFSYRDTHLAEELIAKYSPEMIIMERGFVDSSAIGGGMSPRANLRYLIVSSRNKLMPTGWQDFALCTIANGSYFKVIDISKDADKTQIALLHIPKETVNFFSECTTNYEESLAEQCRAKFVAASKLEPAPELQDEQWLQRIKHPLGMSDDGVFFSLGGALEISE